MTRKEKASFGDRFESKQIASSMAVAVVMRERKGKGIRPVLLQLMSEWRVGKGERDCKSDCARERNETHYYSIYGLLSRPQRGHTNRKWERLAGKATVDLHLITARQFLQMAHRECSKSANAASKQFKPFSVSRNVCLGACKQKENKHSLRRGPKQTQVMMRVRRKQLKSCHLVQRSIEGEEGLEQRLAWTPFFKGSKKHYLVCIE